MRFKLKLSPVCCLALGFFTFLSISGCESAAGYFVAPNGSDENLGTINSPFKTVQKCAELVQPGETCWLRKGTYRETVRPVNSGTESEPIIFAAYQDEPVTISGTEVVSTWTRERDSIFQAVVELPVDSYSDTGFLANQVFVNGEMMPEARFPNIDSERDYLKRHFIGNGVKSPDPDDLSATVENDKIPNLSEGWAGARVWTNEWFVTRTGTITGGQAGKLTAEMTAPWERGGHWFYLFGKKELLDAEGEWFYEGKQNKLSLWSPGGNMPQTVEVKQRNFAFDLRDRSFIFLRNLNLFANTITTSDLSTGIEIDGIKAKYVSHHMTLPPLPKSKQGAGSDNFLVLASHAHDTGIQLRGNNHTLKNSIIEWSSGNGVLLEGKNHTVTNNFIANINYMVSYAAPVRINGSDHKITHNTIKRTARDAISIDWHTAGLNAKNIEIGYNDISRFGMLSTDLGALYICCRVDLAGGSIHHNWIRDAYAYSPFWGTRGIYLDLESYNATIHHNVVWGILGGKHSFYLTARGVRGYQKIYNNVFFGEVGTDEYVDARNNIFVASEDIEAAKKSHNLFKGENFGLVKPPKLDEKSEYSPDFGLTPNSAAIDRGVVIPGITDGFAGDAPDIGAYESGRESWKPGATLNYPER